MYELLTSKPPFYAGEIGVQVCGKNPPSMTRRRAELGIKGEVIPKNWEETVAACLAIDPVQRPQSAIEAKNKLKIAASPLDIPAKSRIKATPDLVAKPQRPVGTASTRKLWPVIAGLMFLLALVSAIAFFSFHPPAERRIRKNCFEDDSYEGKYFSRRSCSRYNSAGY